MATIIEISKWINNPKRKYQDGIKFYNQHKIDSKYDRFFSEVLDTAQGDIHFILLFKKLMNIARKLSNQVPAKKQKPEKTDIKKAKPITVTPIKLDKTLTGADVGKLRSNGLYINKCLTLDYNDLSQKDKEVFFGDEGYFQAKKDNYFVISDMERQKKSFQAKMKNVKTDVERKNLLSTLEELDEKSSICWKVIDDWDYKAQDSADVKIQIAVKEALRSARRIENLKIYISKAEKDLKIKSYKEKSRRNKEKKIEYWKKELEKLENAKK